MIIWFTGLSGAGKTTIANGVQKILLEKKYSVKILDGDIIRNSANNSLGFSPEDILNNNENIAQMCLRLLDGYDFILVPIISPFRETRKLARRIIGDAFILVHVKSDLKTVINRDTKGLYKKALNNKLFSLKL